MLGRASLHFNSDALPVHTQAQVYLKTREKTVLEGPSGSSFGVPNCLSIRKTRCVGADWAHRFEFRTAFGLIKYVGFEGHCFPIVFFLRKIRYLGAFRAQRVESRNAF